jgi:hypothetical protein
MHKTLLRSRRESLGWSRGHVLDLMKNYGFSGSGHKILFIEVLKNNHLKTIECLCRVARFHANTVDDYNINASVHCLESIRQEIDDLLDRVKEQGGCLVFDQ